MSARRTRNPHQSPGALAATLCRAQLGCLEARTVLILQSVLDKALASQRNELRRVRNRAEGERIFREVRL